MITLIIEVPQNYTAQTTTPRTDNQTSDYQKTIKYSERNIHKEILKHIYV